MFLKKLNEGPGSGRYAEMIKARRAAGQPVPGIWTLFAFKPSMTDALSELTEQIMRGPSPLSAGFRELIAARTSQSNHCLF